uniref:SKP1 component POZ domain-containing protein n=1 Tax=Solanum lycopersicum TaxID=4081 RepID=A0A3Q7EW32_SOLLC
MSSEKLITLKTSDGEEFKLEEAISVRSEVIKNIVQDVDCTSNSIPLLNGDVKTMKTIIKFWKNHSEEGFTEDQLKNFNQDFLKMSSLELLVNDSNDVITYNVPSCFEESTSITIRTKASQELDLMLITKQRIILKEACKSCYSNSSLFTNDLGPSYWLPPNLSTTFNTELKSPETIHGLTQIELWIPGFHNKRFNISQLNHSDRDLTLHLRSHITNLNPIFDTLDILKLSRIDALLIGISASTWSAQDLTPLFEEKSLLELADVCTTSTWCSDASNSEISVVILGVQLIEPSCRDVLCLAFLPVPFAPSCSLFHFEEVFLNFY